MLGSPSRCNTPMQGFNQGIASPPPRTSSQPVRESSVSSSSSYAHNGSFQSPANNTHTTNPTTTANNNNTSRASSSGDVVNAAAAAAAAILTSTGTSKRKSCSKCKHVACTCKVWSGHQSPSPARLLQQQAAAARPHSPLERASSETSNLCYINNAAPSDSYLQDLVRARRVWVQPGVALPRKRGRGPANASVGRLPDHIAAMIKDPMSASASFDTQGEVYSNDWAEDRTKRLRSAMASTIQQAQPGNDKGGDGSAGTAGGVAGFSVGMKVVYRDDAVSCICVREQNLQHAFCELLFP